MNNAFVLEFLRRLAANNNTAWMQAHRDEYLRARDHFAALVAEVLRRAAPVAPELAELTPGSVVGEMGLIEPRNRSATVVAREESRVAAISQTDLRQLLVTDGNLGFIVLCNITRVLSDRLRQADEKLGTLMATAIQADA